jgi:hypothetical protein
MDKVRFSLLTLIISDPAITSLVTSDTPILNLITPDHTTLLTLIR